jgi:hypothetical protein
MSGLETLQKVRETGQPQQIETTELLRLVLWELQKLNAYMALITDETDPPQETK